MLAIALVLAQVGALLHASSHDDTSQGGTGIHAQLCGQCLSFSTVLAVAGSHGAPLAPLDCIGTLPAGVALVSLVDRETPNPFRSRAPPRIR